ncbi:MAG: hypothetical protein ACRBCL_02875 [Maritimibacter sp.]
MSFVAEATRLSIASPYPETGQAGYSSMADVLARAVLFANWEVVGAAALVRAGSVTRVVEVGLRDPFRSDEFMRRLTWRLIADAAHELLDTPEIEDACRQPMQVGDFVARRHAAREEDRVASPVPIGPIEIPLSPIMQQRLDRHDGPGVVGRPRMPKGLSV